MAESMRHMPSGTDAPVMQDMQGHVKRAGEARGATRRTVSGRGGPAQARHAAEQLVPVLAFEQPLADLSQPLRIGDRRACRAPKWKDAA